MDIPTLTRFLGWCVLLSLGFVLVWFGMFVLGGDLIFDIHSKLFAIEHEDFVEMNYEGIARMKTVAFLLFLIPYLALKLMAPGGNRPGA